MPKLGRDANVDAKRAQLKDMEKEGFIKIERFTVNKEGDYYRMPIDVSDWTADEVNEYYDERVTEWAVKDYEERKAFFEARDKSNTEYNEKWMAGRPYEDVEHIKKINAIFHDYSADEREEKIKEVKDELRYRQLSYDRSWSKLKHEDVPEFERLGMTYAPKDYAALEATVVENEKELNEINAEVSKFTTVPKKPGFLANIWNKIQKLGSKKDIPSVANYNKYAALTEKQAALENIIKDIKKKQEELKDTHKKAFKEKVADKVVNKEISKEERVFNLAKTVTAQTLNDSGVKDASDEVIESNAKMVMKNSDFQKTVAKLQADTKDVSELDFFKEYNNVRTANAAKASNQPNVVKANEGHNKTNEELNNNFVLNPNASSIN